MTLIDLLAPALRQPLLSADEQQRLTAIAAEMPCARTGGFEIRLDALKPRVDLQINLQRRDARSMTWLQNLASSRAAAAWQTVPDGRRLAAFLDAWCGGETDTASIEELWLEFDRTDDDIGLPSLFVGFPQYGVRSRASPRPSPGGSRASAWTSLRM